MKLTELRNEHEVILKVFDHVENQLAKCRDDALFDRIVSDFLLFATLFIDDNHHGKEEGFLFPKLLANAFFQDIPHVLSEEHIYGRHLVVKIKEALGDRVVQSREIANYTDFMRHHIRLENEMVFDAIESGLDDSIASALSAEFARVESDVIRSAGPAVWERLIQNQMVEIEK